MSVEAVLVIPAFLVFLALLTAVARQAIVQADVHAAAVEAARTAVQEADSASGETLARAAVDAHLTREGVACLDLTTTVDATALDLPPGQAGEVAVAITCLVPLADLGVPGLPGQIEVTGRFSTPIDAYAGP